MVARTPLREEEHLARAEQHLKVGNVLVETRQEWGAVALFYSAYHRVKAAMLRDPIWGQVNALQAVHQDLIPDDRYIERHHGRRRRGEPREWGVNELVAVLYPSATRAYEQLHQASIDVRYSTGLPAGALPALATAITTISELDSDGELEAPINWPPADP
jgi:hypothetical protein